MQFVIITVYYNEKVEDSETWRTLLSRAAKEEHVRCYLVDNSTDETVRAANHTFAARQELHYLDMVGNQGLPVAYNRAIRHWIEEQSTERAWWVITADQDTTFPETYLQQVEEAVARTDARILAPVVKSAEVVLSPCRKSGSRFCACREEEVTGDGVEDWFFINSGLCIRGETFLQDGIRYNEKLFLDFADFDLENQIRQRYPRCTQILPEVVLCQQFSGMEKKRTADQDLERYRLYTRDAEIFYRAWGENETRYKTFLRARGWKLALHHRDARFLKKT